MKVRSLRFEKDYDLQLYAVEENALVIRHRSLEKIYWELPDKERPKAEYEVLGPCKAAWDPGTFCDQMYYDVWGLPHRNNRGVHLYRLGYVQSDKKVVPVIYVPESGVRPGFYPVYAVRDSERFRCIRAVFF